MNEVVYGPRSSAAVLSPGALYRDLIQARELGTRIFWRDVKAQYQSSFLGLFWAFVPPLITSLPFIFLSSQGVIHVPGTQVPFAAFALVGTCIWQTFVDALTAPGRILQGMRAVMTRISFPKEAILVASIFQVLWGLGIRCILLAVVLLWFQLLPPFTGLLALGGLGLLLLLGLSLGLFLGPLSLLSGDVQQATPVVALGLMFVTPVLYPTPVSGFMSAVCQLNPLAVLVNATRDLVLQGAVVSVPPVSLLGVTLLAVGCFWLSWVFLRVALPHIIGRLGS